MFKSYTFSAPTAGKHILILGAVHGNEIAGTLAQQQIIEQINNGTLNLKSGKITFIPIVNEAAYNQDARFIDMNLNRVVRVHENPQNNEEKIANQLVKTIDDCDIMLDLHSTHCEKDKEFAFIDYPTNANLELLSLIPVQTALAGWPKIYAQNPKITNFCTEEYAYSHDKHAITVECGYHKSPEAVNIAKQSILNILAYYDVVDIPKPAISTPQIIHLASFIIKESSGHFNRNFQHLDSIKKDETIAIYDNGQTLTAPFDGYIIMPNHLAEIGAEWFYLGRE